MIPIDKIIFGDNQFFGINHMSQEKAQQQSEKFDSLKSITRVYDYAIDAGLEGFMLNSNDKAKDICKYFLKNSSKYSYLNWYPSIPYPHKYANSISENGLVATINEVLVRNNSAAGILATLVKGGSAIINKDAVKLLQMLVDIELKNFQGLNLKVVFLQNIVTDLILGYNAKDIFYEYCDYVRKKYDVIPGFISQNLPHLKEKLEEWAIDNVCICTSFNKVGYLMSPDIETYISELNKNDSSRYKIMVMSTLASGAISPKQAYGFIKNKNIQSVVFGASSKHHIEETVRLINAN